MNQEIESFLEAVHRMSQSQDWDENHAQELIMCGGELYKKYIQDPIALRDKAVAAHGLRIS